MYEDFTKEEITEAEALIDSNDWVVLNNEAIEKIADNFVEIVCPYNYDKQDVEERCFYKSKFLLAVINKLKGEIK